MYTCLTPVKEAEFKASFTDWKERWPGLASSEVGQTASSNSSNSEERSLGTDVGTTLPGKGDASVDLPLSQEELKRFLAMYLEPEIASRANSPDNALKRMDGATFESSFTAYPEASAMQDKSPTNGDTFPAADLEGFEQRYPDLGSLVGPSLKRKPLQTNGGERSSVGSFETARTAFSVQGPTNGGELDLSFVFPANNSTEVGIQRPSGTLNGPSTHRASLRSTVNPEVL
ncbi:hypothetical protein QFC20_002393 [Naganishia adeliensis]|uniref:Uncharacterized protein n=1 Tax=Naganishia adeliensis TaxID=92952 RepID=A0ACC2WLW9_9TREE|nr:hypothetical protein QFC20_002393 [Naganishia adeliensis]